MKFFLDTANIAEVEECAALGVIEGVTTNPSLIAREKKDFKPVIEKIAGLVDGPVSAEVIATEFPAMVAEARDLAQLAPNVVIKVPITAAGLKTVRVLAGEGIKTNVTLVFSANQALLAARAGATYVSPFVGRLDDVGHDGMDVVRSITDIFAIHNIPTRVIAASIRHPGQVTQAALAGAHIATVPYKVLLGMINHPLTDSGLKKFLADWQQANL